jgi:hypothetical protein
LCCLQFPSGREAQSLSNCTFLNATIAPHAGQTHTFSGDEKVRQKILEKSQLGLGLKHGILISSAGNKSLFLTIHFK